jgi:anaerobic selenocysteine-containing dehydrogenase
MSERVHLRTCPLCEAMCGLEVTVDEDRVTRIRPDREDVWSRGYICPKGTALGELHHDPDRLRRPVVRRGGERVEVGWDEAFAAAHEKIRSVIDRPGPGAGMDALAVYIGNPVAHNLPLGKYVGPFMAMSAITNVYSAGTVDQWPKNVASALMYGGMWTIPVPDIDRTDFLLVLGANPQASQGSLLAAADVCGRLREIGRRGGRVVVVDPRRTGTAEVADEWLPIRPGTDAAFLMAMVNVLVAENRISLGDLAGKVNGLSDLITLCRPFTPEAVSASCGIPAHRIRELARELAGAERAAVYGRIGTCTQEFGTLASWLVEVLNILTGNLDREGGSMFANPAAWSLVSLPNPEFADGFEFGRFRSRVRGAPEVLGQFPVSCLAEEIATPGDGQIRGLITIAGNPAISAPDAGKLQSALPQLDALVSVDNWINETTCHADVILPGQSALEIAHFDDLIWNWSVRNAGNYSPPVFPDSDRPQEWEILLNLAASCMGQEPGEKTARDLDDLFFHGLVDALVQMPGFALEGRDAGEIIAASREGNGPLRLLDFQIRSGPYGDHYGEKPDGLTLADFEAQPHGIDLGPLTAGLDRVLSTASGRIELAPEYITADLARLQARLGRPEPELLLVSRRHLRSNNSWMHNVPSLVTGKDRCTLIIHPDDAATHGLRHGGRARVSSAAGSVVAPVEVSDEMMPGVVCLPHGWGHDVPAARVSVAAEHAGVNNNLLAPGELVDEISGNQVVNGIPVEIAPL